MVLLVYILICLRFNDSMKFKQKVNYLQQNNHLFSAIWIPIAFVIVFLILHFVQGFVYGHWISFFLLIPEIGMFIYVTKISIENKYSELTVPVKQ